METRIPAPSLVILIGPSSSGKSTWARKNFEANEIVSSDDLRAQVGIDDQDQRAGTAAFAILDSIVTERVARRLTTVIDTLGYDSDNRTKWVALAHAEGMPAYAVTFPTPGEECLRRNAERKRPIPVAAMRKQISRFADVIAAVGEEGFAGVLEETSIRTVAPQLVAASPEIDATGKASHTFGIVVSRFNWGKDTDLGETLASIARRAETAGFRDLWMMDHFRQIPQVGQSWEDILEVYTTLGFLAGHTSRLRLGALVTGVTHRHPSVLGQIIATLDVLSNGRANCGIGLGWDHKEHAGYGIEFPDVPTRYDILEDTLQMLPLLWGKGSPSFQGSSFSASELMCYPRPVQQKIPILIGGSGENRTLKLVAKYGDAGNLFGKPEMISRKVEVLHRHCAEIDRDPAEIEVSHLVTTMVAPDPAVLRHQIGLLRGRNQSAEQYASANNAGLSEDLVELFRSYNAAGATHSIVALPNVHLEESIEAFGRVISVFDN